MVANLLDKEGEESVKRCLEKELDGKCEASTSKVASYAVEVLRTTEEDEEWARKELKEALEEFCHSQDAANATDAAIGALRRSTGKRKSTPPESADGDREEGGSSHKRMRQGESPKSSEAEEGARDRSTWNTPLPVPPPPQMRMAPVPPPPPPPQQGQGSRQKMLRQQRGTAEATICLIQLPEELLDVKRAKQQILLHFRKAGKVVAMKVFPEKRKAYVRFDSPQTAQRAYNLPDALCGNRFVRIVWAYHDLEIPDPSGQPGSSNQAAPSDSGYNIASLRQQIRAKEAEIKRLKQELSSSGTPQS